MEMRRAILWAALAWVTVGCGEEAPHGAPPPRDPPPAATPSPAPTGTDSTGTDSTGTDPSAATGTDTTGTDPEAAEGAEATEPPVDPEHPERSFRVRPEQERSFEAYACLGRRDYACIERLLGDGRAQTPGEMSILIRAQRAQHEDSLACASMQSLFERFPESTETARYRVIHYQTCPDGAGATSQPAR
jgi:hypothetical protein